MTTVCKVCDLEIKATGNPDEPYAHLDYGDPVKRQNSVLAHFDHQDKVDAERRAEMEKAKKA